TSRAENRLLLRFDNADFRLTPKAREIGLISDEQWEVFERKKRRVEEILDLLKEARLEPGEFNEFAALVGLPEIAEKIAVISYLKRPEVNLSAIYEFLHSRIGLPQVEIDEEEIFDNVDAEVKYEGYLDRQRRLSETLKRVQSMQIPEDLDYGKVPSLSFRSRAILEHYRPRTIEEAVNLPNVAYADILNLISYIEVFGRDKNKQVDAV
ncbi:MAG: tRNA uridine-5-carboxymethylaminomethyl(34) synthesis enzyme MnmG, partial [Actinobacteria bacterium]|nr:tRNA uridine-5-carboxymethylaminomethyl(34) synthesis enzyme MnmG [Actinomycetota bacterium]